MQQEQQQQQQQQHADLANAKFDLNLSSSWERNHGSKHIFTTHSILLTFHKELNGTHQLFIYADVLIYWVKKYIS
jgi:uncharacterized glyoxalase superfamily protein PhnB